jgi:hypothetical protein
LFLSFIVIWTIMGIALYQLREAQQPSQSAGDGNSAPTPKKPDEQPAQAGTH